MALCAVWMAVSSLPASGPPAAFRAVPQQLVRASSEVVRLAQEAGRAAQRYERGLRVVNDQRSQVRRIAHELHGQRVVSAALRQDAGAVARAQYRTAGFTASGGLAPAEAADPVELLELQAGETDRRERLARMLIEADARSRRLAAEEGASADSYAVVDADVTRMRGEKAELERRLAKARSDLNGMAEASIRSGRCTPVDLDGLQSEIQDNRGSVDRAAEISPSGWTRPLLSYELTAGFGGTGARWSNGHTGQDFAVPIGTPVRAVGAGTVVSIGCGGPFGISMVLRHDGGWHSQYAHLSAPVVPQGRRVRAGEWIGLSGTTGNSTGPHLHLEIRRSAEFGTAVDPVGWLRSRGVDL
ncbi:peptidoglycan DD-metalloendopeptidase family protein [Streptomyces griseocarneus]|uniref:peptidoglycan DD-metalloendopeptidase family protein n=1 Tax=Streptomyces griseocarneus TaxID=51201 RepID=UPI00167CD95B|nr:peptidoglycan DD-metalloendopeptidase family protein [Streptomyces griseocarneus]MBZ6473050.1 peptidoglycan DD-metalloendopeptidase family protein [Streptomyces griseocarneus]